MHGEDKHLFSLSGLETTTPAQEAEIKWLFRDLDYSGIRNDKICFMLGSSLTIVLSISPFRLSLENQAAQNFQKKPILRSSTTIGDFPMFMLHYVPKIIVDT